MWQQITLLFQHYPPVIIFLALAGGYFVGKIKILGFNLGSTAGVLLVALILGQFNVTIDPMLKSIAFALFIFVIGYKVGPEFFSGLKKDGACYILLALVVTVVGLITAIFLSKLLGFDQGTAAGLLGGALTQSAVLGTAAGAIGHLSGLSQATKTTMENNIPIAYAITYVFGTIGIIAFIKLAPFFMRINLKAEARKLEIALSGGKKKLSRPEQFFWDQQIELRAYRVENSPLFDQTVEALKSEFDAEVAVNKIKRGNDTFEPMLDTIILEGDIIAMAAHRDGLLKASQIIGPEVDDSDVLQVVGESLDICVLNKNYVGKNLRQLIRSIGHGCFIQRITRLGNELPLTPNTKIKKCDVLHVTGSITDVERFVEQLGYAERPSDMTNMVILGLGCFFGLLIGIFQVNFHGIPIAMGVGGGVLISGLFCGWLRTFYPTFGQIPDSAQWVFTNLGLNLFIVCVGLTAGPQTWHALQTNGVPIFFAGIILTLLPATIGLLFGRYVLKLNPVFLLGALAGAATATAALNVLKEETDSSLPAIGFTVPYAFSNVILTIWGALIVYLVH